MHRAVLQACLPWFIWHCVASGVALLLVQYCGGRLDWRRLRRLSSCEDGAVQSLSLVLTLPVFLLLVLFIVQITQIMVGIMMVNYAAFAGARSASVWIPADVTSDATFRDQPFDSQQISRQQALHWDQRLVDTPGMWGVNDPADLEPANVVFGILATQYDDNRDGVLDSVTSDPEIRLQTGLPVTIRTGSATSSAKFQKILMAAIVPCLTISPSRDTAASSRLPSAMTDTYNAINKIYADVDPASRRNTRMPARLRNKLAYAANFTTVDLTWQNVQHPLADNALGPTYNPYVYPTGPEWKVIPPWNPLQIGFRDPVTVTVRHQFALLPGIGRILSHRTNPENSSEMIRNDQRDLTAERITGRGGNDGLYTINLEASATFVNEGYKSIIRYAIQPN